MGRFLLFLLLGLLAYLLLKRIWLSGQSPRSPVEPPKPRDVPDREMLEAEDTVRCDTCGVYLPRSEAFTTQGRVYCRDHRPH